MSKPLTFTLSEVALKLALAEIARKRREAWILTGKKAQFVLSLTVECEKEQLTMSIEPEEAHEPV